MDAKERSEVLIGGGVGEDYMGVAIAEALLRRRAMGKVTCRGRYNKYTVRMVSVRVGFWGCC